MYASKTSKPFRLWKGLNCRFCKLWKYLEYQFRSFFVNLEDLLCCWNYSKCTRLKKYILMLLGYRFYDQRQSKQGWTFANFTIECVIIFSYLKIWKCSSVFPLQQPPSPNPCMRQCVFEESSVVCFLYGWPGKQKRQL